MFEGRHGLNPLQSGLVFLALLTGGVLGVVGYVGFFNRQYMKIHRAIKPRMVPPEERLKPLLYAAPLFAVSFFWFGWTGAYRSISIWSPILSIVLLGACVLYVFLTGFNYLVSLALLSRGPRVTAGWLTFPNPSPLPPRLICPPCHRPPVYVTHRSTATSGVRPLASLRPVKLLLTAPLSPPFVVPFSVL